MAGFQTDNLIIRGQPALLHELQLTRTLLRMHRRPAGGCYDNLHSFVQGEPHGSDMGRDSFGKLCLSKHRCETGGAHLELGATETMNS